MTLFRDIGMPMILRAPADAYATAAAQEAPLSPQEALGMMAPPEPPKDDARPPQAAEQAPAGEEVPADPPADDGPDQPVEASDDADDNAGPREDEPIGEDETEAQADPEDDLPPISPPRSWSKEEKADFEALPRATQERIVNRENAREADFRRRQNEEADKFKALSAREQAAEQARQQYEAGVNQLTDQANAFIAGEFSDIKTWDDVNKMARDDPSRYSEWKAATDQAQALTAEQQRLAQENQRKRADEFQNYRSEQTQRFLEAAPEFADPKQSSQLQTEVHDMLVNDYGISNSELKSVWDGVPVSFHDHRLQLIIRDALQFRRAKAKVATKQPVKKPAPPPPQRPGVQPAKGEVKNRTIEAADKELSRTHSREAALRLMRATRPR